MVVGILYSLRMLRPYLSFADRKPCCMLALRGLFCKPILRYAEYARAYALLCCQNMGFMVA